MLTPGAVPRGMLWSLLIATALTACTSWRVQQVGPEQLLAGQHPNAVRVQRADRSRIVLSRPQLRGDSLVGTTRGRPTGVPLGDISQIAVRRGNALKTTGLILGILAAPFALVGVACAFGADCNFSVN
jgi:hypothetical protein